MALVPAGQLPTWRLEATPEGLFLHMGENTSRIYLFLADGLVEPWFQGKPIGDHLGLANMSSIAQSRVDPEDSSSLISLLERFGQPLGGPLLDVVLLGYNEGRSTYFNEPGVYDLVLGSQKPEARAFKRWVTHNLLPSVRRHGSYSLKRIAEDELEQPLAKRRRIEEVQQALAEMLSQQLQAAQELACERQRQFAISLVADLDQKFSLRLQEAKTVFTETVERQRGLLLSDTVLRFGQRFEDLRQAIMTPTGIFLKAIRQAVKAPPIRQTCDPQRYPSEQQASRADILASMSLQLALLRELLKPYETPLGVVLPGVQLTYGAWKVLRNLFGRRALRLRLADHDQGRCERPRLWAHGGPCDNSGLRYVFLADEAESCVRRILRQTYTRDIVVAEHVRQVIASTDPGSWPANDVDLEPQWHLTPEEQ